MFCSHLSSLLILKDRFWVEFHFNLFSWKKTWLFTFQCACFKSSLMKTPKALRQLSQPRQSWADWQMSRAADWLPTGESASFLITEKTNTSYTTYLHPVTEIKVTHKLLMTVIFLFEWQPIEIQNKFDFEYSPIYYYPFEYLQHHSNGQKR